MSLGFTRLMLRAVAIAIAVAALIDPVFTSNTLHDRPVVAIHLAAPVNALRGGGAAAAL